MTHNIELDVAMLEGDVVACLQTIDEKDDLVVQRNFDGGGRVIKNGVSYFSHVHSMIGDSDGHIIIHTTALRFEEAKRLYESLRQALIERQLLTLPKEADICPDKIERDDVLKCSAEDLSQKPKAVPAVRDTKPIEVIKSPTQKFSLFFKGPLDNQSILDFAKQDIPSQLMNRDVVVKNDTKKSIFDINGSELLNQTEEAVDTRLAEDLSEVIIREGWRAGFKFSTEPSNFKQPAPVVATWSLLGPHQDTSCLNQEVYTLDGKIEFMR